jgi:hypothetical protein
MAVVQDIGAARAALPRANGGGCGGAVREVDLSLDEIFEAYVIGRRKEGLGAKPDVERVA